MANRERLIEALTRTNTSGNLVFGTATSIVCQDLMERVNVFFPEAHLHPEKMSRLAIAGHTILGFDMVMPLFSVCHEAAAMGCSVDWGNPGTMPHSGAPIFENAEDITIPADLLTNPGCAVPLKAISLLKKQLGNDAAVCGKVFGSWTQGYHYFGVEKFLIKTLDDPDETRRILEKLLPVAIQFARAQLDAGADCILIADHATSDLCSPGAYQEYLAPLHRKLAEEIRAPLILHTCGNTADRIRFIAQTGLDCFHWDTKTGSPADVRRMAGDSLSLMGGINNLDLVGGSPEDISRQVKAAISAGIDVVGPECAVPLDTPLENILAIRNLGREVVF